MGMESDHVIQARARAASGDLSGALDAINLEITKRGGDASLRIFRARLLHSLGHLHDALEDIRFVDIGAVSARFLGYRAELEEAARRLPDAMETLTRAITLEPHDLQFRVRRALLHQSLGDFEAARVDLERAIATQPDNGELLYYLAGITKFAGDSPILKQLQSARGKAKAGSAAAFHLDFALSKAFDQIGEVEKSFAHLERANAAMRAAYPFEITQRQSMVRRYQRVFRNFDPSEFWTEDSTDFAPIFVTGMPRSGTTLVEQVISSHAQVDAAGETGAFFKVARRQIGDPMVDARHKLRLTPDVLASVGRRYATTMRKLVAPDVPHLTDKSLQTWMYLGLALAAMPKARIVVLQRAAEPTALSNYRHMFRPGKQLFSYNLHDIAIYQRAFDEMLAFWRERCPDGIVTISYEDLVQNPEPVTRQLIQETGLEWDDACLQPEDNARAVLTLSASEVRQPIHTNSLHAWKRYADYLT